MSALGFFGVIVKVIKYDISFRPLVALWSFSVCASLFCLSCAHRRTLLYSYGNGFTIKSSTGGSNAET